MYFNHWITLFGTEPGTPDKQIISVHARWMFALLSRVDEQISADDMSLLRQLARSILKLLKYAREEDSSDAEVKAISKIDCWIVFTIIATVWSQHDLWTDAEDALDSKG